MFYFILTIHLGLCLALMFLVLLQQGKGADLGAALGGASSAFGPGSSANVLTRVTTGIAIAFMVTSIILVRTYSTVAPELGLRSSVQDPLRGSVMERVAAGTDVANQEEAVGEDGVEQAASEQGNAADVVETTATLPEGQPQAERVEEKQPAKE